MHPLNCIDLNLTARRALYGILTFVTLSNLKREVFPRRDTLRAEAMIGSEATLYRGLATLESLGYITRAQKRQSRTGKFYLSPIVLTDKAIVLLGLKQLIHQHRSLKVRDGQYKEPSKETQSLQKSSSNADPAKAIDPKTKLPIEVLPLLQLDVKKSAICMLMAKAKVNGKRLSDVTKSVWHNLYRLRGREVVAYLSYLLEQDRDFASKAKNLDIQHQADIQKQRYQRTLESLDDRYDGCQVVTASGKVLGSFVCREGSGPRVEQVTEGRLSIQPVNLTFAERFAEGEFRIIFG